MLRLSVLALLLINLLVFGWTQGYLAAYGLGSAPQTEPQRLAQQIRPERIRIVSADETRRAEASSGTSGTVCLQSPLLDDQQAASLRARLEADWPPASWQLEPATEAARWVIYLGPYASADALRRKQAELSSLKLPAEPVHSAALASGLSLGVFETQAAAAEGLVALGKRGVRSARVVQERPALQGQVLRLPALDDALRPRLELLQAALPPNSAFKPCR